MSYNFVWNICKEIPDMWKNIALHFQYEEIRQQGKKQSKWSFLVQGNYCYKKMPNIKGHKAYIMLTANDRFCVSQGPKVTWS